MSAYTIEALDLTTPRAAAKIDSTLANPVGAVYVIALPAAAQVHFGQGGQPWDLEQGKTYELCPAETNGIFISNAASAGLLKLGISFETGEVVPQT